jgi:hypothetical protein
MLAALLTLIGSPRAAHGQEGLPFGVFAQTTTEVDLSGLWPGSLTPSVGPGFTFLSGFYAAGADLRGPPSLLYGMDTVWRIGEHDRVSGSLGGDLFGLIEPAIYFGGRAAAALRVRSLDDTSRLHLGLEIGPSMMVVPIDYLRVVTRLEYELTTSDFNHYGLRGSGVAAAEGDFPVHSLALRLELHLGG